MDAPAQHSVAMPDTYGAVAFATGGIKRPISHITLVWSDGGLETWRGEDGVEEGLRELAEHVDSGKTVVTFSGNTVLEWHHGRKGSTDAERWIYRRLARGLVDLMVSFVAEHGHKIALNALLPEDAERATGAATAAAVLRNDHDTVFEHLGVIAAAVCTLYHEAVAGVVGYRTRAGKALLWRTMGDKPGTTTLTAVEEATDKTGERRLVSVAGMIEWCLERTAPSSAESGTDTRAGCTDIPSGGTE